MQASTETKVMVVFSAEDLEKLAIAKINNTAGFCVPEKFETIRGRDSSLSICYMVRKDYIPKEG